MRVVFICVVIGILLCVIGGCGGSTSARTTAGRMEMGIVWPNLPDEERFIPRATQSLVIRVENGTGFTQTQVVPRKATKSTTVTFADVPIGAVVITVIAYPNLDGTGTVLANADAVATILSQQTTKVIMDLNSTISQVLIDPSPVESMVDVANSLVASARDAEGNIVAVMPQPNGFYWTSSDASILQIDQKGILKPLAEGNVVITAMERETGITGTARCVIKPGVGKLQVILVSDIIVTVEPAAASIMANGLVLCSASVAGVPNQAVTWSVQEVGGGTVTDEGIYHAPTTPGIYHVIATSVADTRRKAIATVTVNPARIIFSCNSGANYEIYAVNTDGSNLVELTTMLNADLYPCQTTDGKRVMFCSRRDGKISIFVMNSDGTNPVRLTDATLYNYQASWNPAGTKIVFYSDREFAHDIYIMNADGSAQTKVTNTPVFEYQPCFTADGQHIVYVSDEPGDGGDVYIMNLDGSGAVNLTHSPGEDMNPACSPDGKHIVFESLRTGNSDLYIMDCDGSNLQQITNDEYNDTEPSFSPDGQQVVFSSTRTGDGYDELYCINIDGTNLTQITNMNDGISIMPSWWL